MDKTSTQPQIKRLLRDRLLAMPSGQAIALHGPIGCGKRALAKKLLSFDVTTCHQRNSTPDAVKRIRLHPLMLTELGVRTPEAFLQLLDRGGFPEGIWRQSPPNGLPPYLQSLFSALLTSHRTWQQLDSPERLWQAVSMRVGQTLSIRALAQALDVSDRVVKGWVDGLEAHHGLFRLPPLQSPINEVAFRALKKDQKHYPYDWSQARSPNTKLEALVANHLLQWVESSMDLDGRALALHYFRDCDQREVDFVVLDQGSPVLLINVDPVIEQPNRALAYLKKKFPSAQAWQLALEGPMDSVLMQDIHIAHPLAFLQRLG